MIPALFWTADNRHCRQGEVPYPAPPIWKIPEPPAMRAIDADPSLPPFQEVPVRVFELIGTRFPLEHGPSVWYREKPSKDDALGILSW